MGEQIHFRTETHPSIHFLLLILFRAVGEGLEPVDFLWTSLHSLLCLLSVTQKVTEKNIILFSLTLISFDMNLTYSLLHLHSLPP